LPGNAPAPASLGSSACCGRYLATQPGSGDAGGQLLPGESRVERVRGKSPRAHVEHGKVWATPTKDGWGV